MFDIKGIDHLHLNVKSLKLSKNFYKRVFDLDEKESGKSSLGNEYGGYVEYPESRSIYIIDPNGIEIEISEKFGGNLDN